MRGQWMLMPYDLSEWLPESHLARFIANITGKLDFFKVYRQYQGKGTAAYDPKLLLAQLMDCAYHISGKLRNQQITKKVNAAFYIRDKSKSGRLLFKLTMISFYVL